MNTISSLLAALAIWLPTPVAQLDTASNEESATSTDDAMSSLVFEPRVSRVPRLSPVESASDTSTEDHWALESTLNVSDRGVLPCIEDHRFAETSSPYSLSAETGEDEALWGTLSTAEVDRELDAGRLAVVGTGRGGGGWGPANSSDEEVSPVDQCMDDCFGQRRAFGYCIATCHDEL